MFGVIFNFTYDIPTTKVIFGKFFSSYLTEWNKFIVQIVDNDKKNNIVKFKKDSSFYLLVFE